MLPIRTLKYGYRNILFCFDILLYTLYISLTNFFMFSIFFSSFWISVYHFLSPIYPELSFDLFKSIKTHIILYVVYYIILSNVPFRFWTFTWTNRHIMMTLTCLSMCIFVHVIIYLFDLKEEQARLNPKLMTIYFFAYSVIFKNYYPKFYRYIIVIYEIIIAICSYHSLHQLLIKNLSKPMFRFIIILSFGLSYVIFSSLIRKRRDERVKRLREQIQRPTNFCSFHKWDTYIYLKDLVETGNYRELSEYALLRPIFITVLYIGLSYIVSELLPTLSDTLL